MPAEIGAVPARLCLRLSASKSVRFRERPGICTGIPEQ